MWKVAQPQETSFHTGHRGTCQNNGISNCQKMGNTIFSFHMSEIREALSEFLDTDFSSQKREEMSFLKHVSNNWEAFFVGNYALLNVKVI